MSVQAISPYMAPGSFRDRNGHYIYQTGEISRKLDKIFTDDPTLSMDDALKQIRKEGQP